MIEEQQLSFRLYGQPPYSIAVIHGGPGAAGEMAPVAQRLSRNRGIIEPLQTAASVDGQIRELALTLQTHAHLPAILIGYSWGAWLSILLATQHPYLVKKLILVSSGPFSAKLADATETTRLSRFTSGQRKEFHLLLTQLKKESPIDQSQILARLGALCATADCYSPIDQDDHSPPPTIDTAVFQNVWSEASQLRKTGFLTQQLDKITCPITAIHGDYDPHPADGVKAPLSKANPKFRFILLPQCGHKPWIEQHAKEPFYQALQRELS